MKGGSLLSPLVGKTHLISQTGQAWNQGPRSSLPPAPALLPILSSAQRTPFPLGSSLCASPEVSFQLLFPPVRWSFQQLHESWDVKVPENILVPKRTRAFLQMSHPKAPVYPDMLLFLTKIRRDTGKRRAHFATTRYFLSQFPTEEDSVGRHGFGGTLPGSRADPRSSRTETKQKKKVYEFMSSLSVTCFPTHRSLGEGYCLRSFPLIFSMVFWGIYR